MNTHTMITMDTSENLHLLHICTEEELEVMDLMDIELVYGNSFFKSLATVGNVSEAMTHRISGTGKSRGKFDKYQNKSEIHNNIHPWTQPYPLRAKRGSSRQMTMMKMHHRRKSK
ncbi:Vacuolar protein sorting-associated protein 8-like [Holothuria leucospilota]|nr:Vacuolar protein sorting-associated protein 8-like [Holothuria leucospilota]